MANEPVAWHYPDGKPDQCTTDKAYAEKEPAWTPMYYKHEWVGLTDEEVFAVSNTMPYGDRFDFAEAIEAKLKEKNT
jgi:superfamily I DNA and RNA helicase